MHREAATHLSQWGPTHPGVGGAGVRPADNHDVAEGVSRAARANHRRCGGAGRARDIARRPVRRRDRNTRGRERRCGVAGGFGTLGRTGAVPAGMAPSPGQGGTAPTGTGSPTSCPMPTANFPGSSCGSGSSAGRPTRRGICGGRWWRPRGAQRLLGVPSVDAPTLEALFALAGWPRPHSLVQTMRNAARVKFGWLERVPGRMGFYTVTDTGRETALPDQAFGLPEELV